MAGFSLFNALSTGLLSGLPDLLRLRIGLWVAGFPRERPFATDFNRVRAHAAEIEDQFREEMARDWTNFVWVLERDFTAALSALLFEPPLPQSNPLPESDTKVEPSKSGKEKGSWRPFAPTGALKPADPVEAFYDYFFSTYIHGSESSVPKDDLEEIAQRAVDQSSNSAPPSVQEPGALALEIDAARRKNAVDGLSAVLGSIFRRFEKELADGEESAVEAIEDLLTRRLDEVRSVLAVEEPSQRGERVGEFPQDELTAEPPRRDELVDDDPRPRHDLASIVADHTCERMRTMADREKEDVHGAAAKLDLKRIATSMLETRLQRVDRTFGDPYREAFKDQRKEYGSWRRVRRELDRGTPVLLVDLTENLRRNELRRELIAGSVQCTIGTGGERLIRFSGGDASGPPPYFRSWIRHPGRSDPRESDPKRRRNTVVGGDA